MLRMYGNAQTRHVRRSAKLLGACVLLSLAPYQTHAQNLLPRKALGRYQQYVWNDQQGLPQNSASAITRTRDGYLWIGTFEGAVRFDGARFTTFDSTNTPQFRTSQVSVFLEDHLGNLWIGTNGGGLTRRRGDTFTTYTTADGLSNNFVYALVEDSSGVLWIGTEGGGLSRFYNGRFSSFTTKDGLPGDSVKALAIDKKKNLWVGTEKGLARFADGQFTTYTMKDGLGADAVNALAVDHSGTLWVGTSGGGLSRSEKSRFIDAGLKPAMQNITAILEDRSGKLWIGSRRGGLAVREHDSYQYLDQAAGFVSDAVLSIYEDADDNLWIGTLDEGLCQLRTGRFNVYTSQDGLPNDFVNVLFEDRRGTLWIATASGLASMTRGRIRSYSANDGLPEKSVSSVTEDSHGDIWCAAVGRLYRYQNDRFTLQPAPSSDTSNLLMRVVLGDGTGNLWIGTRGAGLGRLKDGQFTWYTQRDGLAGDDIYALYEGRDGAIWIGTLTGGISRMKDGHITTWTTKNGLASNYVLSFYEDQRATLWIGTGDGGLSRFRDGKFTTIAVRNGLYDNLAFQILSDTDDDSGSLWMSCNKGIYKVSLRELEDFTAGRKSAVTSYVYGISDGMLTRECNGGNPGGWKTHDGRLWFPTVKGAVAIDTEKKDTRQPVVAIERAIVDRVAAPLESLVIRPGQQMLEIQYTAFSWNRPREVRFRYRMEGLDSGWVDADTRRTAYYSHLPSGQYKFHVVAGNGEGAWNLEGQTLDISVLPPFYRSWWFLTLLSGALIYAGFFAYRRRMQTLARVQATQQAFSRQLIASQESERKRIAAELHDGLGQRLIVMKNLALLYSQSVATNGGKPGALDDISEAASRALSEVREISDALRPYQLDRLGLTKAIEAVVRTARKASKTAFTADLDNIDDFFHEDSRIIIYRIVQECVDNILKHADATQAAVTIERQQNSVILTVSDNGKGFTPGLAEPDSRKGGFGLIGISERAQLLGGRVVTESAPKQGTSIVVKFHPQSMTNGG